MRVILCAGLFAGLFAYSAVARENVWSIGPRTLPPPAHASEELRDAIAAEPTPDLSASKTTSPATAAEWKALIAATDAAQAKLVEDMVKKTGVLVEKTAIAGVPVYRVTPPSAAPEHKDHLFIHIHGGAWVFYGGAACVGEAAEIAAKLGIPVISIDYRRPPDFPAPAAMDDAVSVWREVIKTRNPGIIAIGGSSAGGNLTLVVARRLMDLGLPLPGALFVGTPAVDLAKAGDSRFLNDGVDPSLTWEGMIAAAAKVYAGDRAMTIGIYRPSTPTSAVFRQFI